MSKTYVFKRSEAKYIVDEKQLKAFLEDIKEYTKEDIYGKYTVYNVYFDNDNNDLAITSMNKPSYKEKLRIRSYKNNPNKNDEVFFEIKKKYKGVVYKRREAIKYQELLDYIDSGKKPNINSQIFKEIDYFMNFYHPKEKLFLAYDRICFVGNDDEQLRITIDENIRYRKDDISLIDHNTKKLLDDKTYLIEIKTDTCLPLWLVRIMSKNQIYPSSFSKYGKIYEQNHLAYINNNYQKENSKCLVAY